MTAKEIAEMLDYREAGMEIDREEEREAKAAGLVVVYGYSDDNVEFRGAIDDEVGAYNGTTIPLGKDGILFAPSPDCDPCECPYLKKAMQKAKTIEAVWNDRVGPCWTFETDIPHETFTIMENGDPFCVGIVFSMKELEEAE